VSNTRREAQSLRLRGLRPAEGSRGPRPVVTSHLALSDHASAPKSLGGFATYVAPETAASAVTPGDVEYGVGSVSALSQPPSWKPTWLPDGYLQETRALVNAADLTTRR